MNASTGQSVPMRYPRRCSVTEHSLHAAIQVTSRILVIEHSESTLGVAPSTEPGVAWRNSGIGDTRVKSVPDNDEDLLISNSRNHRLTHAGLTKDFVDSSSSSSVALLSLQLVPTAACCVWKQPPDPPANDDEVMIAPATDGVASNSKKLKQKRKLGNSRCKASKRQKVLATDLGEH